VTRVLLLVATVALAASSPCAAQSLPADTPRALPFEYSEGYATRLKIHRTASYATLPLFAVQYAAGRALYDDPTRADWARDVHRPVAYGVGALFVVNTVTGGLNFLEGRKDPADRRMRTAHALLMLVADAGFVATGVLGNDAARHGGDRELHRTVALASIGVATAGYLLMVPRLLRD